MVARSFADLVRDLRQRRTVGDRPPVLLLGAGASVDAGIGAMPELYAFFGLKDFDAFSAYIAQTTAAERYRYLAEFLQTRQPSAVTPGYQALAALCAQNYFDLVLTTNMDPLLDDALAAAQLWRRDYLLIVNGVIRPDRLDLLLRGQSPRVKVVKLHGDLFQRFMAWTVPEMDDFLTDIAPQLAPAVAGRDVVVVGHSLRDARIRELASATGGTLWFTHPQGVPDHLHDIATLRSVIAPEVAFETFFPALAAELGVTTGRTSLSLAAPRAAAAPATPAAGQTLDDLLASVLTVVGVANQPSSTAFVLAEPRVIVCDSYALAPVLGRGSTVTLMAGDGRPFTARVLRQHDHPFGPTLLEVPASVKMPGLRFSDVAVRQGEAMQIAVAAGDTTGVSSGTVTTATPRTVSIMPIGDVAELISLEAFVRAGSSGAPVVDTSMTVRGFIVAGSTDERRPVSFIFPSSAWAAFLTGEPARAARKRPSPRRPRR